LKRYFSIYWHIFSSTLKATLEYRTNFVVQLVYAPAYVGVLFLLLTLAFNKAPVLGGWNQDEAILLFVTFHTVYSLSAVLFIRGIREMLWTGIRMGQFDMILTKPLSAQFLATFGRPEIQQLFLLSILLGVAGRQLLILSPQIQPFNALIASLSLILGILVVYFVLSTYATAGFYVTRAQQIIEFFDKASDQAQYPISMFPGSVQLAFFTFVPIAYAGYVPVMILLGKAAPTLILAPIATLIVLIALNRWAWHYGLRHYSSASS
jgi:ABC-2 type transport system permease protein